MKVKSTNALLADVANQLRVLTTLLLAQHTGRETEVSDAVAAARLGLKGKKQVQDLVSAGKLHRTKRGMVSTDSIEKRESGVALCATQKGKRAAKAANKKAAIGVAAR